MALAEVEVVVRGVLTRFAAVDVACSELGSLPRAVRRVIDAKHRFGPLLAMFGEHGVDAGTLPL